MPTPVHGEKSTLLENGSTCASIDVMRTYDETKTRLRIAGYLITVSSLISAAIVTQTEHDLTHPASRISYSTLSFGFLLLTADYLFQGVGNYLETVYPRWNPQEFSTQAKVWEALKKATPAIGGTLVTTGTALLASCEPEAGSKPAEKDMANADPQELAGKVMLLTGMATVYFGFFGKKTANVISTTFDSALKKCFGG